MITKVKNNKLESVGYFLLIVAIVMGLGFLSGIIGGAKEGYAGLTRPTLTPPDIVFSIVWPILYFMMACSLFTVIFSSADKRLKTTSIVLFALQLAVNLAWPIVFFRFDAYFIAFLLIAVLDAHIFALTVINFFISKLSGLLLIPYGLWLTFATYLTVMIAIFN